MYSRKSTSHTTVNIRSNINPRPNAKMKPSVKQKLNNLQSNSKYSSERNTTASSKPNSKAGKEVVTRTISAQSDDTVWFKSNPSPISDGEVEDMENVVTFVDKDGDRNHEETEDKGCIDETAILESAGTTNIAEVFEVNLSACHLQQIYNLKKFSKMRILDLSCNQISRMENLDSNKELREVKLYDNKLQEISGIERLDELCNLQLQHNRISSIGKSLMGKKKLKVLRLDSNRLANIEAKELAPLAQLTSLDLSNNRLESLTCLNALPALEEVHVSFNKLKTVQDLSRCKQLKEIDLSHNQLTNLSGLKGLSQLMVLSLSSNQITSSTLKALGKLRNLQRLDVSKNKLTDVTFIPDNYPVLEVLNIAGNRVESWSTVKHLKRCQSLTELTFQGNPFMTEDGDCQLRLHQGISSLVPSLEMVDGVIVKRPHSSSTRAPVMRPMSASSAINSRQVENQLKNVESELASFSTSLSEKFQNLRATVNSLPAEPPERTSSSSRSSFTLSASQMSPRSVTPGSSRPGSRCNSRSRILEAQAFAAANFDDMKPK